MPGGIAFAERRPAHGTVRVTDSTAASTRWRQLRCPVRARRRVPRDHGHLLGAPVEADARSGLGLSRSSRRRGGDAHGGNPSCVEVGMRRRHSHYSRRGTSIRSWDASCHEQAGLDPPLPDHLHLDHIEGIGFFAPIFNPATSVHLGGPGRPSAAWTSVWPATCRASLPGRAGDLPGLSPSTTSRTSRGRSAERAWSLRPSDPGATVGYRIEADGRWPTFRSRAGQASTSST
jgi:hypothetical protein